MDRCKCIMLVVAVILVVSATAGATVAPTHTSPTVAPWGVDCHRGTYYPGPTCDSFYICVFGVWGEHRLTLFRCGPGTAFDKLSSVCVHAGPHLCPTGGFFPSPPQLPGPFAPPSFPGAGGFAPPLFPFGGGAPPASPPAPRPPGPPMPSPWPPKPPVFPTTTQFPITTTQFPLSSTSRPLISLPFSEITVTSPENPSCPTYSLDPASIVNCTREGRWEHTGDCQRFYQCIHTMNCILRGFLFRCPDKFQYISSQSRCQQLPRPVPCHKFSDDISGYDSFAYPVIQLDKESISQFHQASVYWDYMPFLQQEDTRNVPSPTRVVVPLTTRPVVVPPPQQLAARRNERRKP